MLKKRFAIISLLIIFFTLPLVSYAQSAILYFSPADKTLSQGESFWINIMVNTAGKAINAAVAYLDFPADKLTPLGVDTSGSVMTMWVEKNAAAGKIQITAGLPTPGFSGTGKIASIGFKVKTSSGSANFKFSQDSAVVTDVGNQNILNLADSGQGNYNFIPLKPITTPQKTEAITPPISSSSDATVTPTISQLTEKEPGLVEDKIEAIYKRNLMIVLAIFLAVSFITALLWAILERR